MAERGSPVEISARTIAGGLIVLGVIAGVCYGLNQFELFRPEVSEPSALVSTLDLVQKPTADPQADFSPLEQALGVEGESCIDRNRQIDVPDGLRFPYTDLLCVNGFIKVTDQDVNGDGRADPFFVKYYPVRETIFVDQNGNLLPGPINLASQTQ